MRTKRNKIRSRRKRLTGKWILSSHQPHKVILGQSRKIEKNNNNDNNGDNRYSTIQNYTFF